MLLLPSRCSSSPSAGTILGAMVLMAVWGAGLGAIGIYNQSAVLRAGREYREGATASPC